MNIETNKSSNSISNKLFVGPAVMKCLAVNPSDEEIEALTKGRYKKLPYTVNAVNNDGYPVSNFIFVLYNEEHQFYTLMTFKVTKNTNISSTGKYQFINTKLQTNWAVDQAAAKANTSSYFDGNTDLRLAYRGEADLGSFLVALGKLNIATLELDLEKDCDITKTFKGDFSSFKKVFDNFFKDRPVRVLLSVIEKDTEQGIKHYQSVETHPKSFTHGDNTSTKGLENLFNSGEFTPRGATNILFKEFTPEEISLDEGKNEMPF